MIVLDFTSLVIIPLIVYTITRNWVFTFVVLCFCLRFLNSPDKQIIKEKVESGVFYAPSSGYIREIVIDKENTHISLFLNIFDNHTQYIPITSSLLSIEQFSGLFLPAFSEHSLNNTRIKTTLYNPEFNFKYSITQITGLLTRRIINFLQTNEQQDILTPGERLGFIVLGSRVDIIIPSKNIQQILVTNGDHINAMQKILVVK
jgi:phosphatidylserine decarboxylase